MQSYYSTIGSFVMATTIAVVAYTSTYHTSSSDTTTPSTKPKHRESSLKKVFFYYRGYEMIIRAEKQLFRRNKLILNVKETIRFLEKRGISITPFLVIYHSNYTRKQLEIIEMDHLQTINERNSWFEEEISDGHMIEPDIEYPLN